MSSVITLRAEELFFLGEIMQANYIDYMYVQAIDDIEKRFAVAKKEAIASLGEKGLVKESISGKLKVKPIAEELMGPVFFGEKEAVAVVFRNGKRQEAYTKFFHFKEEDITCVTMQDNNLTIEKKTLTEVEVFANTLFDHIASDGEEDVKFSFDAITDIVKVKNGIVGIGAKEQTWCVTDGILFCANEDGEPKVTSSSEATKMAVQLLKGE